MIKPGNRNRALTVAVAVVIIITGLVLVGLLLSAGNSSPKHTLPKSTATQQTVDPNYHVTWDWNGVHCRDLNSRVVSTTHCITPPGP